MFTDLYAISFAISVVLIVALLIIGGKQNITYYLLLFIIASAGNMGYYIMIRATTLELAIVGNKLTYFGGVLTPILLLICYMKLCKMNVNRVLMLSMVALGVVVLGFVFTMEGNDYYYSSIELAQVDGMSYLVKEYGPMHSLFYIYLVVCMVSTLAVVAYSFTKKTEVSYKVITLMSVAELTTLICYMIRMAFEWKFELTPIAYVVVEIIILVLIRRINMYEISESVAMALEEHSTYGYIVFDKHMRYVGCNDNAKEYFPEIKCQKVDHVLSEKKTPFLFECFSYCMNNPDDISDDCEHMVERDELILRCAVKDLYYGNKQKKKIGFMIEIIDDTQQQKYMKLLNNYNTDLTEEVRKKSERISKFQDKLILAMADMVENRDSNTGGHIKRTSKVIEIFTNAIKAYGNDLNLSLDFLKKVIKAAPMHDLGKIAVDDRILRKPGKFTTEEFDEMKKHSEKGAEIVEKLLEGIDDPTFVEITKNVANYHHEKWNGEGYPKGLSGEDIPIEARIMALADVFDALVSKRCYKEKMDYDKAFRIIEESSGSHFEPRLAEIFLTCRPQLEEYYNLVED